MTLPGITLQPVTLNYTYDPLNRLTGAYYSDGTYFRYTYETCFAEGKSGNRLSEETAGGTMNSYTYDPAGNRLTQSSSISGQQSSSSYQYDVANRLIVVFVFVTLILR